MKENGSRDELGGRAEGGCFPSKEPNGENEGKRTELILKNKYGENRIVRYQTDMGLSDVIDLVVDLLTAAGYHPDNIKDYIPDN